MSVSSFQFTVIGVAVMLVVGGLIWFGTGAEEPPSIGLAPAVGDDDSGITVHVAGAVVAPGLVTVPSDARIADALARAGGAAWNADLASVNLAARVREAMLPWLGERYGNASSVHSFGRAASAAKRAGTASAKAPRRI